MATKFKVSILVEFPEDLHELIVGYIEQHSGWDQDRFMEAATSLFLLQNSECDPTAARTYLDAQFGRTA